MKECIYTQNVPLSLSLWKEIPPCAPVPVLREHLRQPHLLCPSLTPVALFGLWCQSGSFALHSWSLAALVGMEILNLPSSGRFGLLVWISLPTPHCFIYPRIIRDAPQHCSA